MITNGLTMATDFKVEVHTTKNRGLPRKKLQAVVLTKLLVFQIKQTRCFNNKPTLLKTIWKQSLPCI